MVERGAPQAAATSKVSWGARIKRFALLTGLLGTALGAAFLTGYLQGRTGLEQLKSQLAAEKQALASLRESSTKQLETERNISLSLAARRSLDQAIAALDERNFGIATQAIRQADKQLAAGHATGRAAELAKHFEAFRLIATEDLGAQRKQLVDWKNELDQLITTPTP